MLRAPLLVSEFLGTTLNPKPYKFRGLGFRGVPGAV